MGQPIRPIVIAHRGASGYLPEHTLPAKALAYTMGADYLEQDVVATGDGELVVLHDVHLDRISDVATAFPDRQRDDGRYYVRDFALDELRTLLVHERRNADGTRVYPGRHQSAGEEFRIHTLAEELQFIADLQQGAGRPVGIYPEIKRPAWHRNEGIDMTPAILDVLYRFGYDSHDAPVYLQCFDHRELKRLREELECPLKLVQLIGDNDWRESDTDYERLRTADALRELAGFADGVGPWIKHIYRLEADGSVHDSGFVSTAHDVGLAVHPFTFRRDQLPPGFGSFRELLRFAIDELSVDGLFTDFPDLVVNRCGD